MKFEFGYASAWTPYAKQERTRRDGCTRLIYIEAHARPEGEVIFTVRAELRKPNGEPMRDYVPAIPYSVIEELRGRVLAAQIKPERYKAEG